MEFPNRENVYIPLSKLKDYLLSETHSVGKSKAKLLRSLGFNEMNIDMLMQGLISIAHSGDIKEVLSSPHGVNISLMGCLERRLEVLLKCGLSGLLIKTKCVRVL